MKIINKKIRILKGLKLKKKYKLITKFTGLKLEK